MDEVSQWVRGNWFGLLGFLVGAVGVLLTWQQRRPKKLDYWIRTNTPVLSARVQEHDLQVLHHGRQLEAPRLVEITVQNTGKVPVLAPEYVKPITVTYEQNPPVTARVIDASKPHLKSPSPGTWVIVFNERDVILEPDLINPGDWLTLQLLSDGDPGRISVSAEYAGGREMRQFLRADQEQVAHKSLRILAGSGWISLGGVLIGTAGFTVEGLPAVYLISVSAIIATIVLVVGAAHVVSAVWGLVPWTERLRRWVGRKPPD